MKVVSYRKLEQNLFFNCYALFFSVAVVISFGFWLVCYVIYILLFLSMAFWKGRSRLRSFLAVCVLLPPIVLVKCLYRVNLGLKVVVLQLF